MERAEGGIPGRPEALPGGLCRGCRSNPQAGGPETPGRDMRTHAARLRAALGATP